MVVEGDQVQQRTETEKKQEQRKNDLVSQNCDYKIL